MYVGGGHAIRKDAFKIIVMHSHTKVGRVATIPNVLFWDDNDQQPTSASGWMG